MVTIQTKLGSYTQQLYEERTELYIKVALLLIVDTTEYHDTVNNFDDVDDKSLSFTPGYWPS